MTSYVRIFLSLVLGLIVSSVRPIGCQELQVLTVGIHPAGPATVSVSQTHPSEFSLNVKSVGWAVSGSVLAGAAGFAIDQAYCNQHRGDEPSVLFGPCFLYAGEGVAAGWFGGAIVGATLGAAKVAQKRGCPRRESLMRTFAGAALGAAPGLIIVAGRPGKYPPSRSAVIVGTPLLAGVVAAAAVMGCKAP
jgi:hypothetical protein